jgi:hypothetical protein
MVHAVARQDLRRAVALLPSAQLAWIGKVKLSDVSTAWMCAIVAGEIFESSLAAWSK